MRKLPSLELLNERFNYNIDTGVLTRNIPSQYDMRSKTGDKVGRERADGYQDIKLDGVRYLSHRICYYMHHGVEPDHIDHINGVRGDNRLCNLRSVNRKENNRNAKRRQDNTSGNVGVCYHKATGKWRAKLGQSHLGSFTDKIDAIYARHYAQADAGYHTNHGR